MQTNSVEDLLKLLESMVAKKPEGSSKPWYNPDVPNQPGVPFWRRQTSKQMQQSGNSLGLGDIGSAKPVADGDRSRFGIDPRDPNRYSVMPDGRLIGTLMGWSDNMPKLEDIAGKPGFGKLPQFNVPGGIQTNNMIPRAKPNQYGMTRVSPGVYKDEKGATVRSSTGRPRTIKMTETETKKG